MTQKTATDLNKLNFEQALLELEQIVSKLESGEAGLDEAMEIYQRGQQLKDYCAEKLSAAKLQVEKINLDPNGTNTGLSPFNSNE